jgi:formylglycine-generating enzyme required for sulfatase activity
MLGNVYEWVEDCYDPSLSHTPADGSALKAGDCYRHVMRGGAWINDPDRIRAAYRSYNPHDWQDYEIGFRVAKTLN